MPVYRTDDAAHEWAIIGTSLCGWKPMLSPIRNSCKREKSGFIYRYGVRKSVRMYKSVSRGRNADKRLLMSSTCLSVQWDIPEEIRKVLYNTFFFLRFPFPKGRISTKWAIQLQTSIWRPSVRLEYLALWKYSKEKRKAIILTAICISILI